jgi:hypothetical protein
MISGKHGVLRIELFIFSWCSVEVTHRTVDPGIMGSTPITTIPLKKGGCKKWHIGRNGGIRMENDNQNKLEIETQPENQERDFYKCVKARSGKGFVTELNKAQKIGYKPIWDSREIKRDTTTEPATIIRTVMCYDTEAQPTETDPMELEIIEALDMAEGHVIETSTSLTDEKNRLLIDTDYTLVNAERAAMDPPRPPVKTAPEKKAWVESMVSEREVDLAEAKRWKKYVEAMARKGELPQRESPWELKARLEEKKAQAQDEKASQVVPEKVQNPGEAQEAE